MYPIYIYTTIRETKTLYLLRELCERRSMKFGTVKVSIEECRKLTNMNDIRITTAGLPLGHVGCHSVLEV